MDNTLSHEQLSYVVTKVFSQLWGNKSGRETHHSFQTFCADLLRSTQIAVPIVMLTLLYVQKFNMKNPNMHAGSGSEYRVFVVALMLASKYLEDNTFTTQTWSEVSHLSTKELTIMQREFLCVLDHRLHVPESEYMAWIGKVHSMIIASPSAKKRSICTGVENGLFVADLSNGNGMSVPSPVGGFVDFQVVPSPTAPQQYDMPIPELLPSPPTKRVRSVYDIYNGGLSASNSMASLQYYHGHTKAQQQQRCSALPSRHLGHRSTVSSQCIFPPISNNDIISKVSPYVTPPLSGNIPKTDFTFKVPVPASTVGGPSIPIVASAATSACLPLRTASIPIAGAAAVPQLVSATSYNVRMQQQQQQQQLFGCIGSNNNANSISSNVNGIDGAYSNMSYTQQQQHDRRLTSLTRQCDRHLYSRQQHKSHYNVYSRVDSIAGINIANTNTDSSIGSNVCPAGINTNTGVNNFYRNNGAIGSTKSINGLVRQSITPAFAAAAAAAQYNQTYYNAPSFGYGVNPNGFAIYNYGA